MNIYDRAGAPNPARIRIVLTAKGLEDQVEFVSIDLIRAEQKSDAYLAKNPIGKIPLLELDDGTVIVDRDHGISRQSRRQARADRPHAAREGPDPHDAAPRRAACDGAIRRLFSTMARAASAQR